MQLVIKLIFAMFWFISTMNPKAQAGIAIGANAKIESSTQEYSTEKSVTYGGTVEASLGVIFRVGYTLQIEDSKKDTYPYPDDDPNLRYYVRQQNTTHSIDLTMILYPGDVFVPYVFGGIQKHYVKYTIIDYKSGASAEIKSPMPPNPTGGFGFGMRFSRQLMLKFSNRWVPGHSRVPGEPKAKNVLDTEQTIGLSFEI